jgi:flagellar FliL protein
MPAKEDDLDLSGDEKAAAKPKKSRKMLIISIVVLFLSASAGATAYFTGMLGGEEKIAEEGEEEVEEKVAETKQPLNYIPLDPAFVVNFGDDSEVRFLQITIELGTRQSEMVDQVKEHRPAIRNNLVMLFSNQDPLALNTREGKEKLREETLVEVQKVLEDETGDPGVEKVFFTSFVMQ